MISPFKLKPLKTYKTSSALKTLFAIYVTKTFVLNWCESFFSLVFNFRDSPLRARHENEHARKKARFAHVTKIAIFILAVCCVTPHASRGEPAARLKVVGGEEKAQYSESRFASNRGTETLNVYDDL